MHFHNNHCLNKDYQVSTARNKTKMWTLNMSTQMTAYCAHTSQEPFLSHSPGLQHHSQTKFYCNHGNCIVSMIIKNLLVPQTAENFLGSWRNISCARQLLHWVTADVFMMFSAATATVLSFLCSNMLTVTTVLGKSATCPWLCEVTTQASNVWDCRLSQQCCHRLKSFSK